MNVKNICLVSVLLIMSGAAMAQSGIIYIKSNPGGARVLINNQETNRTTPFQMAMNTGDYTFRLISELYQVYNGKFTITNNSLTEVDIALVPNFGSLRISSNPSGADCFLEGRFIGKTPLLKDTILAGERKIEISLEDYEPFVDRVIIESQKTAEKIYPLVSSFGTVGILAEPKADIYINNNPVANHVFSGELKPGVYRVEARKDKHISQVREITVSKGEEYLLNFTLVPMSGNLFILSNPPEADIYLNEKAIGKTPFIANDLIIGDYNLLLRKEGFADYSSSITITHNKTQNLDVSMSKGYVVTFNAHVDSAEVFLDDCFKGLTPLNLNLAIGNYRLRMSKYGFQNIDTLIKVTAAQAFRFELRKNEVLNDTTETLSTEQLTVTTNPGRAIIQIIGNKSATTGMTPIRLNIPEGDYEILLELDGFIPAKEQVAVKRLQTNNFHFEMVKSGRRPERYDQGRPIAAGSNIPSGSSTAITGAGTSQPNQAQNTTQLYTTADSMPSFPNGDLARMSYLVQNLRYPEEAKKNGIQGKVRLSFVVESNGKISRVKVTESLGAGCDEEAVRLVQNMPEWNPGLIDGKPVSVEISMSISFMF